MNAHAVIQRRLRLLGAGSIGVVAAPTVLLVGLAWVLQACCCAGPY